MRIGNECSFAKTYAASPSLLVLVRHSKEVVTKDDLMKMVWPDTLWKANLSRNIFMLRKAISGRRRRIMVRSQNVYSMPPDA